MLENFLCAAVFFSIVAPWLSVQSHQTSMWWCLTEASVALFGVLLLQRTRWRTSSKTQLNVAASSSAWLPGILLNLICAKVGLGLAEQGVSYCSYLDLVGSTSPKHSMAW